MQMHMAMETRRTILSARGGRGMADIVSTTRTCVTNRNWTVGAAQQTTYSGRTKLHVSSQVAIVLSSPHQSGGPKLSTRLSGVEPRSSTIPKTCAAQMTPAHFVMW